MFNRMAVLPLTLPLCLVLVLGVGNVWGQTPNGTLDFGTIANGTTASTANTGFGGVRVGAAGGGFTIQNPGQSIGVDGEFRGIAPTSAAVNSVGITSTEYGTAATTFTISFELHLSGGASGTWHFFAGNGTSFGSAQSAAFTGSEVFTGIQWVFGASSAITTNNRAAGVWSVISGTPFAQSTSYYVTIIGNNSSSTVNYGASNAYSVSAYTYDLWVNGSLAGDNLAKGQLTNSTTINAFRFYGISSTSNVATIALDNIRWYNTCTLPPTHLALVSVPTTGTVGSNLTSFTTEARSGSSTGPVANSFTGAITVAKVSGAGSISGTTAPNATAGVATYSNIQFSSADTYTINATAAAPIVNAATSSNITVSSSTPSITLADNGSQVTASSVAAGTTNVILHQSSLAVTTANATLTGVSFTTAGTYAAADVSNFKVWYSADNSFATTGDNTQLGSTITTSLGSGAKSVSSLSQAINSGSTGYIFITTDIAASPTGGNTINVSALTTSDFTFSSGSKSGSTTAGGAKTLQSAASPTLTAGTISGSFGNVCINSTSSAQSFTLSGSNLNGTDVSVSSSSSNYTFATSSGGSYSNPLTLTAYNGSSPGTMYVKFAPTAAGADNANISIAGGGASAATVSQSSNSGVNTVPTVTTPTSASLSTTTVTLGGTISSIGCSNATTTGIYYSTSTGFADGAGTAVSTGSLNISSTPNVFTQAVTGLTTNTQYYFKAFATNSGGNGYSSQGSFITFPTAPAGLSTGSITNSGFTVSWTDLAGTLEFYEIQIFSDAGFSTQVGSTYTTATNASSQAISGLSASTNYYYRVRAVNNTNQASSYSTGGPVTTSTAPCLSENFSSASSGDNTTTGGQSSTWNGGSNFTGTLTNVYQAGGAVKLGVSAGTGSMTSASLSGVSGDVTVSFDVKGWTTVEGNIDVTLNGTTQTVSYTAVMAGSFETKSVQFSSVPANSKITFATTAKRAFIDNIVLTCTPVPEINIKQSSTNLVSGSGSFSLGTVTTGSSSSATTFTIENTGAATLNLTGTPKVAISGHTNDFTIDQTSTSATVSASGTTTFTVTFSPTTTGARSATISIANNDSNENPYTFTVTGTGATYAPTVTTSAATSISTTGATLNGEVTSDGGATVTERGFVYKTSSSVTISDNKTTVAGTTGTFILSPTSLSVNTQYYFRAYAINSVNTTLGSELNFWTLANAPAAPTVNTPTGSSLNVTIGASDGNPSTTTYAIQETTSGNYVQANGALGASAVWQTSATWSAITVTGLSSATTYTFQVKARNGANTETTFGATTSGTTSSIGLNSVILSTALTSTYGSVSSGVSFTASGTNLTSYITATAQSGFQVSTDNSSFGASVSVASGATVYVGFTSTLSAGNYNNQIAVVLSGGGAAGNANVTTSSSGNTVSQKVLSITTPTIASKVYDGTTTSGTVTAGTLSGFIGSETVVVASANGTYSDANGGTGKTATITYTLGNGTNGGLATNYSLANTTATGDITQATQTITFSSFTTPITSSTTIVASSNFGGAITYSSSNTNVATINSSTGLVTIAGNGTTTITASNAGNSNYTAASTSQVLTVNPVSGTIVTFPTSWSGTPASAPSTSQNSNLSGTVTATRGAGLGSVSSSTRFNSDGWPSGSTLTLASNTDYLTFTLTASTGYVINLNNSVLSFGLSSSGTGPQVYGVYSSVNGFSSTSNQIGSNLTTSSTSVTFPSSGFNDLSTIEIRIYAWNASASTGTGGFNSMSLTGTLSCTTPSQSSAISGTTTVCSGSAQNYSVTNVSGTGYTWSLPDGSWSGSSTSNSITANVGSTEGTISVTPYNAASGCSNYTASSQSISVTVNATPNAPTASPQSFCSSASPTVADLTVTSGSSIKWYDASTNGNLVASETALTSTNYYASQTVSSCESATRTSVAVTVNANGTWIGDSNDDWNDANNWCGGIPNSNSIVVSIPSGVTVNLDTSPSVSELTIASTSVINAGSNTVTIANGGTFTNNGTFNAQTGTVAFSGTGTLAGNATTFNNLTTSGNLTLGASPTISGTLTLSSGTLTVGSNTLTVNGSISRTSGNIDASNASATVVFGGSTAQTIPASTFTGNINNLTLNNSAGLTTNQSLTVANTLNLSSGVLTLGTNNLTLTGSLHASNNGSSTAFINTNSSGAFIRSISSTGVDYKFPVGLSDYAPISVNFTGGTIASSTLASRAVSGLHPEAEDGAYIRSNLYWQMNQSGMTNPQYNVSFTYPGVTNGVGSSETEANLLPAKWSASTGWLSSGSCAVCYSGSTMGTSSINTGTKTLTWNGVSGFSDFGGFGEGNGSPLPVELLSFSGNCENDQTELIWKTASENNSDYFDVLKSQDGENWRVINTQAAAGFSTTLQTYSYTELEKSNEAYYRLNQVDINGNYKLYDPIYVDCNESDNKFETYPNPSSNGFNIALNDSKLKGEAVIVIRDAMGKVIFEKSIFVEEGINLYPVASIELENGVYFITIEGKQAQSKLIKHIKN